MSLQWLLLLFLFLGASCELSHGAFVPSRDCFDSTFYDSQQLRFRPAWTTASIRIRDDFPLYMGIYGVFNNASTPAANSTLFEEVHAVATVDISTLGFTLLQFNLTQDDFASKLYTAPDIAINQVNLPPALFFIRDLDADMSFTTLTASIKIYSTDQQGLLIGCIEADFTQVIGARFSMLLRYAPLGILIVCGIAALVSGYRAQRKRQIDAIQNSAPKYALMGMGDCLQYIQFVILSGSLTLNYPGYYQPLVSSVSWSTLMFNNSFIGRSTFVAIEDGIYQINGTEGLATMSQAIGNVDVHDLWLNMLLCLLCITGGLVTLTQLAYCIRWLYRTLVVNHISANLKERTKLEKLHETLWTVVKLVFSYFLLPIVALTFFQIYRSALLPRYNVYIAIALVFVQALCLGLLFWYVRRHRNSDLLPESNTSTKAHSTGFGNRFPPHFGMISVSLIWVRGLTIGLCQKSGLVQVVVLLTCEVAYIIATMIFRPSPSFFSLQSGLAIWRLVTLALAVTFVPAVGASVVVRDWMGYVILTMHAGALITAFFLGALVNIVFTVAKLRRESREGKAQDEALEYDDEFRVYGKRQLLHRTRRIDDFDSAKPSILSNCEKMQSTTPTSSPSLSRYNSTESGIWPLEKSSKDPAEYTPSDITPTEHLLSSSRYVILHDPHRTSPQNRTQPQLQSQKSTTPSFPTNAKRAYYRLPRANRLFTSPQELDASNTPITSGPHELEGNSTQPHELEGDTAPDHLPSNRISPFIDTSPIPIFNTRKIDYSTREGDLVPNPGYVRRRFSVQNSHLFEENAGIVGTGLLSPNRQGQALVETIKDIISVLSPFGKSEGKEMAKGFEVIRPLRTRPELFDEDKSMTG